MATVRELLKAKGDKIWSISPKATAYEALQLMAEKDVGALLVLDEGNLVGVFSERDYARKLILEGKASKDTKIEDVMTARVCHVTPDQTVKECMVLMSKNHFRHLPVVSDEAVVGVISMSDIVGALLMSLL